jgi:RNA polymerase sigma factor (sigma-70 family)
MGQKLDLCAKKFILEKMQKEGISSITELSRRSCVDQPTLSALIGGRISPKTKKGGWRKEVVDLATFFECLPGALFGIKKKSRARGTCCIRAEQHFARMRDNVRSMHNEEIFHPERALFRSELARRQDELLASLTPQEKKTICLCFGFDGKGERTLKEVGKELGISRPRAGQLKNKAFEKLQRSSKLRSLYAGE